MNKPVILPVILAGGAGIRLWPLSRNSYPKQFLTILGAKVSLFQATLQRLPVNTQFLAPLIVCHEEHRFLVAEQTRQIAAKTSGIILEPIAKNTAPAIALAAHWAQQHHPDAILLVLPADHFLPDADALLNAITATAFAAQQSKIVTFGVSVTRAETGYGYIEKGQLMQQDLYSVKKFIEKPDHATAQTLMNEQYLWNSGMFMFNSAGILRQLQQFAPEIVAITQKALEQATRDLDFTRINLDSYAKCPSISIDYAVMEHTSQATVHTLNCAWSDVGSWQAVWEHSAKDANNNALLGDVVVQDVQNCFIEARHRLVTAVNVQDLTIIETNDAIMISKRNDSEGLKALVATLKQQNHPSSNMHRQVMRPWGYYDCLIKGERFQVKVLVLHPGRSISLQLHHQRSEHWVVVKGNAKVVRGDEEFMLNVNESTFIPIGMKHQLINVGKIDLEVIEVQSGDYLGEDDIVRFKEEYAHA